MISVILPGDRVPPGANIAALVEAHRLSGAVVTIGVERTPDVAGRDVVVLAGDGRVVGYQRGADPAEALSDVVDTGVHVVSAEAFDYLDKGSAALWSGDVITLLLEHDVPVYAAGF